MTFLRLARARGDDLGYVVNIDGRRILDIKVGFNRAAIDAGFSEPMLNATGKPLLDSKRLPRHRSTIVPHVLRHTAGTWMAQKGVPLWQIAGWLGHSHERTSELYAHHCPDYLDKAKEAFD